MRYHSRTLGLANVGVDTFIRVGSVGGRQEAIPVGSLVVVTAAHRGEGTSRAYLPPEFPAVADLRVTTALLDAAAALGSSPSSASPRRATPSTAGIRRWLSSSARTAAWWRRSRSAQRCSSSPRSGECGRGRCWGSTRTSSCQGRNPRRRSAFFGRRRHGRSGSLSGRSSSWPSGTGGRIRNPSEGPPANRPPGPTCAKEPAGVVHRAAG